MNMTERKQAKADEGAQREQRDAQDEQQPETDVSAVEERVQSTVDQETERGYRGVKVDSTANSAYTVAGVTSGEPVPEAAADPVAARRDASNI